MARRRKKTEQEQAREFAIVLPVVLGLFALLAVAPRWVGFLRWEPNPGLSQRLLIAIPLICLVAAALPGVWLRLFGLWMKLAAGLSWFMTRVVLTIFFFVILTPFVLVMRLFGKKPLDLTWKTGRDTYWIEKEPVEATVERYRRQF